MSVLEFKGYSVDELSYKKNAMCKTLQKNITMKPKLSVKNTIRQHSIIVTISLMIGSMKDAQVPFMVKASVSGQFEYHADEDQTGIGVDTLIKKNAVAILYPYVRAIVSNITNASNEYPALILPTINVAQVLDEQNENLEASN